MKYLNRHRELQADTNPTAVRATPTVLGRRAVLSAAFGLFASVASFVAAPAQAQIKVEEGPRPLPVDVGVIEARRMPTLGCCECLGGQNKLDLSTIPGNNWLVNGQPAVAVTSPNSAWSTQTSGAQWIAPNASANGGLNQQNRYTLRFNVQNCTIPQTVVFKGLASAADNYLTVSLIAPSGAVVGSAQCTSTTGHCFNGSNQLNNFAAWSITQPGVYTLQVDANNISGPTGMFIKAVVEGQCTKEPVKPGKRQGS